MMKRLMSLLALVMCFAMSQAVTVSFSAGDSGAEGETYSITDDSSVTIPSNYTLYLEGYTLTGWTDGTNTYATGDALTEDADLTPIFTENSVSLDDRSSAVTVYFNFRRDSGAPSLTYTNTTGIWVTQAEVDGETIDVKMDFDCTTTGKVDNSGYTDWCVINIGTTLTVPSCAGATITVEAWQDVENTMTFGGDTDYTTGTTVEYTAYSSDSTIDIVIGSKGSYFRYVQVVLPVTKSSAGTVYENEAASVVWPFNSASTYESYTATPEDGFASVTCDIGDATITGTGTGNAYDDDGNQITFLKLQPAVDKTDEIEFFVKPKGGLTFTPTVLSSYIQRFGTNVSDGVSVYATVDGTKTLLGNYTAPRSGTTQENDNYGSNDNYTNQFVIELTEEQQEALSSTEGFTLSMTIGTGNAKQGGFAYVTIEGLLNGTIADLASYSVTAETSPEGAGEITFNPKGSEFEEGTEIKVTVEKNFGYEFVNWTDDEGTVLSESKTFVYTVERDAVLTANFNTLNTYELDYSVSGGANLYMLEVTPEATEVDDKTMYEEGTVVTLTASSNTILTFTNWSDGQSSTEISITMDEDKTIVANYSAVDYIAGWDFYTANNGSRVADFYAEDNDADVLILRDESGTIKTWLDKSVEGGSYNGRGASTNWQSDQALGYYYWQTMVNAEAFTDIQVISAMMYSYNAYTTYDVEYSLDGETWTAVGSFVMPNSGTWYDETFDLPSDADNQSKVYIRWKADTTSDINGTTTDGQDGICLSGVYIVGTESYADDGTAPVLVSSVPEEGSSTASPNGKVVLTFDEKVVVADDAEATLGDLTLTPTVSGKTVMFSYKGLDYNTEYTFTLPANSVADRALNYNTEAIVINFSTRTRDAVTKKLYDFVVPDDGTFQEAIEAAADREDTGVRYRIFVKKGYYVLPYDTTTTFTGTDGNEYPVPITYHGSPYVSIIGEDMDETILENDIKDKTEEGTGYYIEGLYHCTTLLIQKAATNTYIQDITLWNGLNDKTGRGEALEDNSDKTICKNVYLHGYQDTYLSNNSGSRFYFEGGILRGNTDYLCGSGDVFYNGVELRICGTGHLTAPATAGTYGYVFRDCTITGEGEGADGGYDLGRPWGTGTPKALYVNTTMEVLPKDEGWADMGSDNYPGRFAEYNSMTSAGTVIDLSNRKTTFGDSNHENDPILTEEEAAELTIDNVMGGSDDWDPTYYTEQASAPTDVVIDGTTLTWDDSDYVLLWAVCKDGDVVDFTLEPTYTVDDTEATWSVRAANEMGGLGEATEAVAAGETAISEVSYEAGAVVSTQYYNLQGVHVDDSYHGAVIRVETTADGAQTATKIVR